MDKVILDNLENSIKPGDVLYYLGDLTFKMNKAMEFFERFNQIEIHYIIGNHDSNKVIDVAKKWCASVSRLKDISIDGQPITLCHYAMRVWNRSHFNAWQLYGHSHATLDPMGKQYDVGVDNNEFLPVSFDELKEIMKNRPSNVNHIPPENRSERQI